MLRHLELLEFISGIDDHTLNVRMTPQQDLYKFFPNEPVPPVIRTLFMI